MAKQTKERKRVKKKFPNKAIVRFVEEIFCVFLPFLTILGAFLLLLLLWFPSSSSNSKPRFFNHRSPLFFLSSICRSFPVQYSSGKKERQNKSNPPSPTTLPAEPPLMVRLPQGGIKLLLRTFAMLHVAKVTPIWQCCGGERVSVPKEIFYNSLKCFEF